MIRFIVLDGGPLGLASDSPTKPVSASFLAWISRIQSSGARIVVPEIVDYELRRELLRTGATRSVARLDDLRRALLYVPITTDAMRLAAEFWARARKGASRLRIRTPSTPT
jgi:predicted nucleic acid-binding protein